MMQRKILFVTYDLGYAGTNSALSSIYNCLSYSFQIKVFPLIRTGIGEYSFRNALLKGNYLTHLFYAKYEDLTFKDKCASIILKLFRRLISACGYDIENIIINSVAKRVNKYNQADLVVAFQEGRVTKFASYLDSAHKVAWVHCDYQRVYSATEDYLSYYNKYERIICVSDYTRKAFIKCFTSLTDKVQAVNNLLDTGRIMNLSKLPTDDVNFSTEDFTLLSLGRLTSVKRFDQIPRIASQLVKCGTRFHWYIIGDGEEKNKILSAINEFQVSDYVTLLGRKSNPYPYFLKSQLLVSTSSSEACPMIFNEAKILNLPILSADFPTSYEFVDNGVNGIICPIDEMCEAIVNLMEDTEQYSLIKENAHIADSYNETIITQLMNIFSN